MTDVEYLAVVDPADPGRMTYWRETATTFTPWPPKARYGPVLLRTDVPAGLDPQQRTAWIREWYVTQSAPWWSSVRSAIDADRRTAMLRFAAFTARCCCCGRALTDPESKTYGVGPECRSAWPDEALAWAAAEIGRLHAERLAQPKPRDLEES